MSSDKRITKTKQTTSVKQEVSKQNHNKTIQPNTPLPEELALRMENVLQNPIKAQPQDILKAQDQFGNQTVQRVLGEAYQDSLITNERGELDESLAQEIRQASQSGQRMQPSVQEQMTEKLGQDFSNVRIHTNNRADKLSQQLNARAFTIGNQIFFRRGVYNTDSTRGRYTLAHELTHVVQQSGRGDLNSTMTLGPREDRFERQADQAAGGQNGAAIKSGSALHAGTVQRKKLSFKDLMQLWELKSEKPVTGGATPRREPFARPQIPTPAPNVEDLQTDLPSRKPRIKAPDVTRGLSPPESLSKNPTPTLQKLPATPQTISKPPTPRSFKQFGGPVIGAPLTRMETLTDPKIKPIKDDLDDIDIEAPNDLNPSESIRKPSGFSPFDPTKDPDDIKLSGKLVGTSQFRGDWKKRTGAAALGFGATASLTSLTGKGIGLKKEYMDDGKDKDTVGDISTGLGIGASSLSMIGKGLGFTKGLGDLFGKKKKKYRGSKAGTKIRKEKSTKAALDMTSNVIGFGKGASGLAKGISKFSGDDASAKGAGYAGGSFGILGGLLGGGKSLVDFIGSGISGGKALKSYGSSKDENMRKIAKVHAHQRTSKLAESGLGMVKGLSDITGGIGSILSTVGLKKTGGIMGMVGSGLSLLSGLGQKTAKGFGSKDTGAAAKGLAERIKAGNPEALKYAKSLGIDPKTAFGKDPEGWDKKDIGVMSDLIKMKMGG